MTIRPRLACPLTTLLTAVAIAAGAAPANPLVGIWRTIAPGNVAITVTLNADGSEDQTVDAPGRFVRMQARYTAANGIFTETFMGGTMNGKRVRSSMGPQSFHYTVTPTTLTLTQAHNPLVFQRYQLP